MEQLLIRILVIFIFSDCFGQTSDSLKLFHLSNSNQTNLQDNNSEHYKKGDLLFRMGLGTKSHFGNYGLSTNLFFSKNFSIKTSVGGGPFNKNGLLFSLGPEFILHLFKDKFLLLGSVWTAAGGTPYNVIDDELPTRREYTTYGNQYIRSYTGIEFNTNAGVFTIEIGYSYALYTPKYTLYRVWTPSQIEKVKKAMGSGLLVSLTVGGLFTNLFRKRE